ncbi:hypothetical protein NZD85_05570 [Empedobacter stercoris]|uniref:hypothetical protein n=1 Tax=Empedobacter stercoris TaxID=1628248 RepID=UPI0021AEF212|nr:hypothetical protein [Empedobacter stercoris]UWX68069.1 hypothetical protein NZD85_05570 [Empedobacter stercoris]
MEIRIFYSWQSSTNKNLNRFFIKKCVDKAVKRIEDIEIYKNFKFIVEDSTQGLPGSPSIADSIYDRIKKSHIFIGDLSVINNNSFFEKLLLRFNVNKPLQNSNVAIEHGYAISSIGKNRIIGVLNSNYGSPHDDANNIAFDIRHMRFPIEYKLCQKKEINLIEKDFINQLKKAIISCAEDLIQYQLNENRPFKTWNEWFEITETSQKFRSNQYISNFSKDILDRLKLNNTVRILGLSGIGKSRILLEIFKPIDANLESYILSNRVLYYDYSENEFDIIDKINSLQKRKEDKIIILDNCDREIHKNLLPYFKKSDNKLKLISIDSNLEEQVKSSLNDVIYYNLDHSKFVDVVTQIVKEDFSFLSQADSDLIIEFSQGNILMASLLSDKVKHSSQIGELDDVDLVAKLLGIDNTESETRSILRACSLFNYLGFDDEYQKQLQYIATNKDFTCIDVNQESVIIDKFKRVCSSYLKKQIFEKRGRFITLRPMPLAFYLASEWLEQCDVEKMQRIITYIENIKEDNHRSSLVESFAKQMRYMNYNDNAVKIVERLVSIEGSFHNAKVLNTELGSRLFRSFVEVNPVATSKTLWSIFNNLTYEEILVFDKGRRNLVWSLEKLSFDSKSFKLATKVLYLLANSENENISNNSTGILISLFKILLPGTEANLEQRFEMLEWISQRNDINSTDLFIKCINAAFMSNGFYRMMGPEQQGTKILKDYHPNSEEIKTYRLKILSLIDKRIKVQNKDSEFYINIIISSLRSFSISSHFEIILESLETILEEKKWNSIEILKVLKQIKKYDSTLLSSFELSKINQYIERLSKIDFKSRLINAHNLSYIELEDYSHESQIKYYEKLGEEFIFEEYDWDIYIPILASMKPNFTGILGKSIYEIIKSDEQRVEKFIKSYLESLEKLSYLDMNLSLLNGFISSLEDCRLENIYKEIYSNEKIRNILTFIISSNINGYKYFYYLEKLYSFDPNYLIDLKLDVALSNCTDEERILAYRLFLNLDDKFLNLTINSIFHFNYGDNNISLELKEFLEGIFQHYNEFIDYSEFNIVYLINKILKQENNYDFAILIYRNIVSKFNWEFNTYSHDLKSIFNVLISKYFKSIWPILSDDLLGIEENYIKYYKLKDLIGFEMSFQHSNGILFHGDIEAIFKWASEKGDLAKERIISFIPLYNNDNITELSVIATRCLNEFGNNKNVLDNFSSRFNSYSWTGSLVPLYENKIQILKGLLNHKHDNVSQWAAIYIDYYENQIKLEKNKDEELYL